MLPSIALPPKQGGSDQLIPATCGDSCAPSQRETLLVFLKQFCLHSAGRALQRTESLTWDSRQGAPVGGDTLSAPSSWHSANPGSVLGLHGLTAFGGHRWLRGALRLMACPWKSGRGHRGQASYWSHLICADSLWPRGQLVTREEGLPLASPPCLRAASLGTKQLVTVSPR